MLGKVIVGCHNVGDSEHGSLVPTPFGYLLFFRREHGA